MDLFLNVLFTILIGYGIGCVNPAYILGKLKGKDVKKHGSGNAGASNALILFGKIAGIFCALFDIFKAYFAIWLCIKLFGEWLVAYYVRTFVIAALSVIYGHIFPFYTKFRGGKGLACIGGMVLFYDPIVFLIMLMSAVVFVLLVNYICFVPMAASAVFPVIYLLRGFEPGPDFDFVGALILFSLVAVVVYKHLENIKRIAAGNEFRISYLWNKNKELERCNIEITSDGEKEPETAGK